ncbi:MAG: response regulator [Thermodesulfovibrionales bacterium]|nr:response regulator [Thermodesulfovibrionales bacterium]
MPKGNVIVIDDSATVRKLAEVVLKENGYNVFTAEDGEKGLDIAQKVSPSLILVDFVMPKMNGYQFCKLARKNPSLKDVPIILITAKGEAVGEKFTEEFGVIDYFIKPFQPEELVEKVNSILSPEEELEGIAEVVEETEVVTESAVEETIDRLLSRYLYKELPVLIQRTLSDILKHSGVVKTSSIILSGDLSDFSVSDLLQLLDSTKATGKLSLYSPLMTAEIYFDKGNIYYASTSKQGRSLLSGEIIEKKLNVSREAFYRAYRTAKKSGIPILRAFVDEKILTESEIMKILEERTREAVYSSMELDSGNFFFERMQIPPHLTDVKVRIPASHLILEGARRVDERKYAAKMFQDPDIIFIRLMTDVALEDINLDDNELRIFSLIDGKRTLNDIIKMSGMEENEVKRIIYTLTRAGILRRKGK